MIDITKMVDNEKELKDIDNLQEEANLPEIAVDIYDSDCWHQDGEKYMQNCFNKLLCDYDYLKSYQIEEVMDIIKTMYKKDTEGCGHFDGDICTNIQCGNYGHYCDCPSECDYYEGDF